MKKGFASIYIVYSFFLIFIVMMLSVLMINNYKKSFLNVLKNDIKEDLKEHSLPIIQEQIEDEKAQENEKLELNLLDIEN